MNLSKLKPKTATAIINSLVGGVVPKIGVQYITVGRTREVEAILHALREVKTGHSMVKFWIGEFGSGKSFILHLLNTIALKEKFVTATADFTPERRLYGSQRKAVAIYSELINNLSIQTKPDGGALPTLLEKWIEQILMQTATQHEIPLTEIRDEEHLPLIQNQLLITINELSDVGGYEFGLVVSKYYEGYIKNDSQLKKNALRWLKGEYTTKTEARQDLNVRSIIDDGNFYDMLKNFTRFFTSIGYSGFMVNFDEAINLYKITHSQTRDKNYEKILSIYNDCFQGKTEGLFVNFAGTHEFLSDQRRGLFSYNALKTRLESNKYETNELRDFTQPVIQLRPLSHNEIFVLLQKLKQIFDFNYSVLIDIDDDFIQAFMEEVYNRPGTSEFLTPREVIRDFLNILSLLRQNPEMDKQQLLEKMEVSKSPQFSLEGLNIEEL